MQLLNKMLHEHLYKGVLVYLNDILIHTETMAEYIKLVRGVLKKLWAAKLYAKLPRCKFHQSKIDYLGYYISHEGIEMDPQMVQAVLEWTPPTPGSNYKASWHLWTFTTNSFPYLPR